MLSPYLTSGGSASHSLRLSTSDHRPTNSCSPSRSMKTCVAVHRRAIGRNTRADGGRNCMLSVRFATRGNVEPWAGVIKANPIRLGHVTKNIMSHSLQRQGDGAGDGRCRTLFQLCSRVPLKRVFTDIVSTFYAKRSEPLRAQRTVMPGSRTKHGIHWRSRGSARGMRSVLCLVRRGEQDSKSFLAMFWKTCQSGGLLCK